MHKCRWNDPLCLRKPRLFGCICGKGGSTTTVYQPTPPPQPSTADAISAWVSSMPQVFAQQLQFAPQEAQQQLELLQQYGQPMGAAMRDAQAALYPETAALQEQLAGQATAGIEGGVPEAQVDKYRSDIAAGLGTNVGSGIGADYMSRGLLEQQQNYQNYYRNLGLSLSQRQPLAQPQMPQATNYMSGFTPQSTMNFMASNYGNFAQASRPMMMQQGADPWQQMLGRGIGGLMGGIGMGMMSSKRYKKDIELWVKG